MDPGDQKIWKNMRGRHDEQDHQVPFHDFVRAREPCLPAARFISTSVIGEHKMHIARRLSFVAAAAALLLCGAQADQLTGLPGQQMPQTKANALVGIGVICNTSQQAEQYVSLRAQGQAISPAMTTLNRRAKQPRACGIAAIAFVRDQIIDTKPIKGKLVQIVRVNVVAGYNGQSWRRIANTTQYAVIETKGVAV